MFPVERRERLFGEWFYGVEIFYAKQRLSGSEQAAASRIALGTAHASWRAQIGLVPDDEEEPMMKRMLLGIACAVSLVAFTSAVARADDKPAGTDATAVKKTHHKKKKAADSADKAATGTTGTTTK